MSDETFWGIISAGNCLVETGASKKKAWKYFFKKKGFKPHDRDEAIRAYEAIGYRCAEIGFYETGWDILMTDELDQSLDRPPAYLVFCNQRFHEEDYRVFERRQDAVDFAHEQEQDESEDTGEPWTVYPLYAGEPLKADPEVAPEPPSPEPDMT